mgnify:CR=1 FL=1
MEVANLEASAALEMAGWSVRERDWPAPLLIKRGRLVFSPKEFRADDFEVGFGSLNALLRATLPITHPGETQTTGTLEITADGDASTILSMTQRFGIIPREIASMDFPVTAGITADIGAMVRTPDANKSPIDLNFNLRDASLLWGRGSVLLYRASEPIVVDPGELRYDGDALLLRRLTATVKDTRLLANAELRGAPISSLGEEKGPVTLSLRAEADGTAEELVDVLSRVVHVPFAPDTIAGFDGPLLDPVGLHLADVAQLLGLLDRLVDGGKSVVVIEHHQAVMAHADWIVDLGPGAGHDGGRIVFQGTPAELVAARSTLTGQHLAEYVAGATAPST